MCILFVNVVQNPQEGGYRIILAANRDEFYKRPSKKAAFWEDDGNIIGGRDMAENKEGGTWLAMSKQGKIGVLLNLSVEKMNPDKQGRGFLVVDYLKDKAGRRQHLETLKSSSDQYNKFHLVAIESCKDIGLSHYCNKGTREEITTVTEGLFALGNGLLEKPYAKVKEGQRRFSNIVRDNNRRDKKENLLGELLALLKWNEKHEDKAIDSLTHLPKSFKDECCSVYIDMPSYGTRTHTIILVDHEGRADFYEWTLKEPIDPNNKEWIETHEEFQIVSS